MNGEQCFSRSLSIDCFTSLGGYIGNHLLGKMDVSSIIQHLWKDALLLKIDGIVLREEVLLAGDWQEL